LGTALAAALIYRTRITPKRSVNGQEPIAAWARSFREIGLTTLIFGSYIACILSFTKFELSSPWAEFLDIQTTVFAPLMIILVAPILLWCSILIDLKEAPSINESRQRYSQFLALGIVLLIAATFSFAASVFLLSHDQLSGMWFFELALLTALIPGILSWRKLTHSRSLQ